MPRFQLIGYKKGTGRKSTRTYEVRNKEDAVKMAASEGLIVDMNSISILPDPPPTERQIQYAKKYDIKITKDMTGPQLSQLLTQAEDEEWPTKNQLRKAKRLGIKITPGITEDELDDLIWEREEEREDERYKASIENVRTIEKTGKSYKAFMLIGILTALISIVFVYNSGDWAIAGMFIIVGIGIFVVAKIGAWWHHG